MLEKRTVEKLIRAFGLKAVCIVSLVLFTLHLLTVGLDIGLIGLVIELGMNIYYEEEFLSFSHGYIPFILAFIVAIVCQLLKSLILFIKKAR